MSVITYMYSIRSQCYVVRELTTVSFGRNP